MGTATLEGRQPSHFITYNEQIIASQKKKN